MKDHSIPFFSPSRGPSHPLGYPGLPSTLEGSRQPRLELATSLCYCRIWKAAFLRIRCVLMRATQRITLYHDPFGRVLFCARVFRLPSFLISRLCRYALCNRGPPSPTPGSGFHPLRRCRRTQIALRRHRAGLFATPPHPIKSGEPSPNWPHSPTSVQ